jgi:phage gpG-like protein
MPSVDGVTIVIDDKSLEKGLGDLLARISDPDELMTQIGGVMERNIQGRFSTKTDPSGAPWAPLKPSTRARYDKQDTVKRKGKGGGTEVRRSGSLLERTRRMRQSLSSELVSAGESIGVRIGFGVEYEAYHEFGTEHMARRGLLTADPETGELGAQDRDDILELVNNWLVE